MSWGFFVFFLTFSITGHIAVIFCSFIHTRPQLIFYHFNICLGIRINWPANYIKCSQTFFQEPRNKEKESIRSDFEMEVEKHNQSTWKLTSPKHQQNVLPSFKTTKEKDGHIGRRECIQIFYCQECNRYGYIFYLC